LITKHGVRATSATPAAPDILKVQLWQNVKPTIALEPIA